MNLDFSMLAIMCVTILYFLLPAYISNSGGLIFGGGIPVDFGKSDSNGNRWIGDGVTWRGLIGGTLLGTLVGAIQGYFGPDLLTLYGEYIVTPIAVGVLNGVLIGFLLAFGALVGDAAGSFIKRRLGIGRGKPAPILDQIDFLVVALLFASLVVNFTLEFIVIAIILTMIIHLIANTGAYLLGIKDVWY
ncbi:MAG: CDP-2,3-bis-(O-geranylgeranyl)-sn-glycerol synthase [Methanobrevibacter sp.]|uniref:CDP-2,3-bis-(O-geranylgeranyl)-sn-glycerol synthase n=1 Tax=Methanobrevibacter sp. TaxID=66852 RepID=UPI0025E7DB1C|nr:CDP-2,3-bis-(O-geranylgeranyl)-sn-glycerol synthase [Methanobrevibacter sp.]MBR0271226.1 CDP-2,3-bis-(O-geranylgeranyl)-sn-glycerol synthase [Methanobrevibacter sp.]